MHILFGWSKKYSTPSDLPIKAISTSPDDPLFATLSDDNISIYYTDHRGYRLLSKTQIQPGGSHIVWKPDSSAIAVAGPGSQVKIYTITLIHSHNKEHESARVSLFRTIDCMYGSINCITADGDHIMVGTNVGYLLVLVWSHSQVLQALSPDVVTRNITSSSSSQSKSNNNNNNNNKNDIEENNSKLNQSNNLNNVKNRNDKDLNSDNEPENDDAIVDVHFCQTIGICGVVLADGRVSFMFLLNREQTQLFSQLKDSDNNNNNSNNNENNYKSQNENNIKNQNKSKRSNINYNNNNNNNHSLRKPRDSLIFVDFDVHLVQDLNACSISINPVGSLAALGCKSGKIVLFRIIDGNHIEQIQWLRSGDEDTDGGHKGSALVSFSRDGTAIGVGYAGRGMAVFNVAGGERIISASKHRPVTFTAFQNILPRGVRALDWETSDEGIVLVGTDSNTFTHLPLLRWIDAGEGRCTLLGRDRLLLFQPPTACLANLEWQHVPLPPTYLRANYPIKYVATSPNGRYYAVAGKRGFAVYTLLKDRWRVFGVEAQEQAIHPLGLVWIDNKHIAVIDETQEHGCGMLVFPRDHLDVSSLVGSFDLPHIVLPIKMTYTSTSSSAIAGSLSSRGENDVSSSSSSNISSNELQIVIYDSCDVLHMMFVRINNQGKAQVEPFKRISTNMPFKKLPLRLATACIEKQYSEAWQHLALVLGPDHVLRAVSFDTHQQQILCRGTSYFWIERIPETPHEFLLFTSSPHKGLTLNLIEFRGDNIELNVICVIAENDYEVIPFGCDKSSGVFVCASMGTVITPAPPFTLFEMHTKMYPYAHRVLYRLISFGLEQQAAAVASRLSIHPSFRQVLEWLLHHVVQDSAQPKQDLPKVMNFIQHYSCFHDVVVNCLRKTDVSYWDGIFHAAGSAASIFDQCLKNHQLHEAAYMLQVLRNTDGLNRAFDAATSLLVPVLSAMEYQLANDLIRFISVTELEMMEHRQQHQSQQQETIASGSSSNERRNGNIDKEGKETIENKNNEENNENENENGNTDIKENEKKEPILKDLGKPKKRLIASLQNVSQNDKTNQTLEVHWVDMIAARHARQLLSQFHLFQLAFMARTIQFELVDWLRYESNRSAQLVPSDWKFAFDQLHMDLDLPRTEERLPAAWHIRSRNQNTASSSLSSSSSSSISSSNSDRIHSQHAVDTHPYRDVFAPAQHRLFRIKNAVDDMRWLETQFSTAQCNAWLLLVATLLCDVNVAVDALSRVSQDIRNAFDKTMNLRKNSCYRKFVQKVYSELQ